MDSVCHSVCWCRGLLVAAFGSMALSAGAVSVVSFNDLHEQVEVLEKLASHSGKGIDLAVLNGDMLEDVRDQESVKSRLLAPMRRMELRLGAPVVFVRGNHETRGIGATRLWQELGLKEERYYSARTIDDVRFVFLDTCENADDALQRARKRMECDAYLAREREWLKRELASADWRGARARIVLMHIPPAIRVADAPDGVRWFAPRKEAKALLDLQSLLNGAGVSLVVGGHHHWRLFQPAEPGRDYPVVLGGGADVRSAEPVRCPVVTRVDVGKDVIRIRAISTEGKEVFRRDLPLKERGS